MSALTVATDFMKDEALRLAAQGWRVFPVAPGSKSPFQGTRGVLDATTDANQIRSWWDAIPEANIGIACGGPSRIVAVDVDTKSGGPDTLIKLQHEHGPLPATVRALTPTGGFHLLFRLPVGVTLGNRTSAWPGVDIRADRGYVVAPPSVHPNGGQYRWIECCSPDDLQPAELPGWMIEALTAPQLSESAGMVTEGKRNATLTSHAGALRARGLGEDAIFAALLGLNSAICQPPLREDEVRGIAKSIASRPAGQVGQGERSRGFTLLNRADLASLPSVEWLIDGVLPANGLAVLYGPSGGGKTFTALSMAYAVSVGIDWLAHGTLPGPAVYIAAEGRAGLRSRVEALERVHGLDADSLYIIPEAVQLARDGDVMALIDAIAELPNPPALIVLDTLARCLVGGDENSAKDVGLFVAGADRLRETFGCAVLVIHHSGKTGETYRGSSSLIGAADSVIRFDGSGGLLTLISEKMKDAEQFGRINALLMPSEDSCAVVLSDGTAPTKDAPLTRRVVETLRAEFGEEWATRPQLAKACGFDKATSSSFHKAITAAETAGLVEIDKSGTPHKVRAISSGE